MPKKHPAHPVNTGEDNAAGAAWIRSEEGRIKHKTTFTTPGSATAEALIVFRAIQRAYQKWPTSEVMFVNTDAKGLCKVMWPFTDHSASSKAFKKVTDAMQNYLHEHDLEGRFKWVKAHQQSENNIRAWLNNWCDREAARLL
jgi:hypothetical protein